MSFPSTEVPVPGIYSAVSRAAHPCSCNSCSALLCHAIIGWLSWFPTQCHLSRWQHCLPFLFPRSSSLWPSIHNALGGGIFLPAWAGLVLGCPSLVPHSLSTPYLICPVSCSARGHLPSLSGDLVSIPVPYLSLCFAACLAWQLSRAELGAQHPQFSTPSLDASRAACRGHEGCSELNCCHEELHCGPKAGSKVGSVPTSPTWTPCSTEDLFSLSQPGWGWGQSGHQPWQGEHWSPWQMQPSGILPPSRSCKVSSWS